MGDLGLLSVSVFPETIVLPIEVISWLYFSLAAIFTTYHAARRPLNLSSTVAIAPVTSLFHPLVASALPVIRYPGVSRSRRFPMTAYPFMASASPVPEAADPDLTNNRRRADILNPGWRWGSFYDFLCVVNTVCW